MITEDHPLYELQLRIEALLKEHGPMIGRDIVERLGTKDYLNVWKVCKEAENLRFVNSARYYIRYDITRENQLRLSPSLLRNFLSFTLTFLAEQFEEAIEQSVLLSNYHRKVSLEKLDIARQAILSIPDEIREPLLEKSTAFIAGDIAYFLAHEEPRENTDLGVMVKGSDIDILVVHDPSLSPEIIKAAEDALLKFKYLALKSPQLRQELDFLIKPTTKMMQQYNYGTIHDKIACKILYESFFLAGNLGLYEALKADLEFSGAKAKIETDFNTALSERKNTISKIFALENNKKDGLDSEIKSLFYFSQERLEFE